MDYEPRPETPGDPGERRGALARRRTPLVAAVAGGVVAAGLGGAVALGLFRQDPSDDAPPPAAEGGLKIELGNAQGGDRIDPARPLRCFVEGKFVGELIVAECAKKNGVATQNLDVGIDTEGELAAVVALPDPLAEAVFPEPRPQPRPDPVVDDYVVPPVPSAGPEGECLRHSGGEWRTLGEALELDTCVQVLFQGKCEPSGSATYGRWRGQTLRLVTGRVEIARDGATFSTLVEQDASCMLP
jgi:hypothetical protein